MFVEMIVALLKGFEVLHSSAFLCLLVGYLVAARCRIQLVHLIFLWLLHRAALFCQDNAFYLLATPIDLLYSNSLFLCQL